MKKLKEKKKINYKVIVLLIFICVFIYALLNKFVTVTIMSNTASMYMYKIKGAQIVILGLIIYIYSLITKNKKAYYTSIVVIMCGYLYTFHAYFKLQNILDNMGEYATNDVSFGKGLSAYLLSFIIFFADIFIKDNSLKKVKKTSKKEVVKDTINIDDKYIFAYYVYGIKKRPDLYNKLSILVYIEDTSSLEIFINGDKLQSIHVLFKDIVSIDFKPVLSEENNNSNQISNEKTIFNALIDSLGLNREDYTPSFNEKIIKYNKLNAKQTFDIEITYKKKSGKQKLMFRTKENPRNFINKIKDKSTIINFLDLLLFK